MGFLIDRCLNRAFYHKARLQKVKSSFLVYFLSTITDVSDYANYDIIETITRAMMPIHYSCLYLLKESKLKWRRQTDYVSFSDYYMFI